MDIQSNLPVYNQLIIIGGSGRNVGKTTLATSIITKISPSIPVIGLKVSTFKSGDEKFHGNHSSLLPDTYRINIETGANPLKDTAKMIFAGAKNAYFIETTDSKVFQAYNEFLNSYYTPGLPIVCESQSLRKHVKPGLFILIIDSANSKKFSEDYINLADYVCYSESSHNCLEKLIENIEYTSLGWTLNNTLPPSRDEVI